METERRFVFGKTMVRTFESGRQMESPGVILFLHGRFSDVKSWQPLVADLQSRFKCVALELPEKLGFWEQVALVEALLDRLTADQVSEGHVLLVGHDSGGGIAQAVACLRPKKVAGVVLLNAVYLGNERGKEAFQKGLWGWKLRGQLKRWLYWSSGLSNETKLRILAGWKAMGTTAARQMEKSWPEGEGAVRWKKRVSTLNVPALLLWGAQNCYVDSGDPGHLSRILPDSTTYFHETGGHWLQLECPEWVAYRIREFAFKSAHERPRGIA